MPTPITIAGPASAPYWPVAQQIWATDAHEPPPILPVVAQIPPDLARLPPASTIVLGANAGPVLVVRAALLEPEAALLPPLDVVLSGANARPVVPARAALLEPEAALLPPLDVVLSGANARPVVPVRAAALEPEAALLPPLDVVLSGANAAPVLSLPLLASVRLPLLVELPPTPRLYLPTGRKIRRRARGAPWDERLELEEELARRRRRDPRGFDLGQPPVPTMGGDPAGQLLNAFQTLRTQIDAERVEQAAALGKVGAVAWTAGGAAFGAVMGAITKRNPAAWLIGGAVVGAVLAPGVARPDETTSYAWARPFDGRWIFVETPRRMTAQQAARWLPSGRQPGDCLLRWDPAQRVWAPCDLSAIVR